MKSAQAYFRRRGWKDLIFLTCIVALAYPFRHDFLPMTDRQKWEQRPQLHAEAGVILHAGQDGMPPCFFTLPPKGTDQSVSSGSVGDCLQLAPDGRELDLFEAFGPVFAHVRTDLWLKGPVPLAFTRVLVSPTDWDRRNGNFVPNVYNLFLTGSRFPYTFADWRLPDGQTIHYKRISPGTGFANAVYEAAYATPIFGGSRMAWNGQGWDISLEDGTTYLSPEAYYATRPAQGSLVGIFDKQGREIRLLRNKNGDLTQVQSPTGGWIQFTYDPKERMTQARASSGDIVEYGYDSDDRLSDVRYSTGEITTYGYGPENVVVKVDDKAEGVELENKYDSQGELIEESLNGRIYAFRYQSDKAWQFARVEIITRGETTTVLMQVTAGRLTYTVSPQQSCK